MYNNRLAVILITVFITLISGCGGGGGGASVITPNPTTFSGSASAGELVTYTMDTNSSTYSYTIVESQYGLTGHTGSGTLISNGDGSYMLSGIPNSKAVILQNGMLVAAIRDTFSGVTRTVTVFGVSNPLTTLAAAAATYNFESYQCATLGGCATVPAVTSYGTFQINSNGTWVSCDQANYATAPGACVGGSQTGTLVNLGAGKWRVLNGAAGVVGTALAYTAANGQNVMLIDLHDPTYFGYGIVVGSSQAAVGASDLNGIWISGMFGELNGAPAIGYDLATVTGGNTVAVTNEVVNGVAIANSINTFSLNNPWNGMIQNTLGGSPSLFAGTGMVAHSATGAAGSLIGIGFKI